MDYYRSEELNRKKEKKDRPYRLKTGLKTNRGLITSVSAVLAAVLLAAWVYSYVSLNPDRTSRLIDTIFSVIPGQKATFYFLLIEKNGKDYRLTEKDAFEISYRDEFVIKEISASVLFGWGLSADFESMGTENDLGILLKGVDLVDRVMASEKWEHDAVTSYRILVKYRGSSIADIPVKVDITPQDWVRQAKKSESPKTRIESLRQAAQLNHIDPSVNRMLAKAYLQEGQTEKAISEYKKILAKKSDDGQVLAELAKIQLDQKKYSEAAKAYRKIVQLNPRDAAAYANLAYAYEKLGSWEAAKTAYAASVKLDKDNVAVRYHLAVSYDKLGQYAQAAEHYRMALKAKPGDDSIMTALAAASFKSGNHNEAVKTYSDLIKKNPADPSLHANMGIAYGAMGKTQEEIAAYKKSLSLNPKDSTVHLNLAQTYVKTKKYSEAASHYEKAIMHGEKDPQIRYNLGFIYDKMGKTQKSISEYEKYVSAKPNMEVMSLLADRYTKMNDLNGAIRMYERMIKLNPKKASLYAGLGHLYGLKGNVLKEIEYYRNALRHDNEDDGIHLNLAEAYEKKGLLKEALNEYTQAYRLNPESEKAAKKIPQLKIKLLEQKHK